MFSSDVQARCFQRQNQFFFFAFHVFTITSKNPKPKPIKRPPSLQSSLVLSGSLLWMVSTHPQSNFTPMKDIFSSVSIYLPYVCRRRYSYVLKELHYKRSNLFIACRQNYHLNFGKLQNSPLSEYLMTSTDWSTKVSWLSTVCRFTRQSGEDFHTVLHGSEIPIKCIYIHFWITQ